MSVFNSLQEWFTSTFPANSGEAGDWVCVVETSDLPQAQLLASQLDSEGIDYRLDEEIPGHLHFGAVGNKTRLFVKQSDHEPVKQIIQSNDNVDLESD